MLPLLWRAGETMWTVCFIPVIKVLVKEQWSEKAVLKAMNFMLNLHNNKKSFQLPSVFTFLLSLPFTRSAVLTAGSPSLPSENCPFHVSENLAESKKSKAEVSRRTLEDFCPQLWKQSPQCVFLNNILYSHRVNMKRATLLDPHILILKKGKLDRKDPTGRSKPLWQTHCLRIRPLHDRLPGPAPPPLTSLWNVCSTLAAFVTCILRVPHFLEHK